MTHERKQSILLFFQGFTAVVVMGLGLCVLVRTWKECAGFGSLPYLLLAFLLIVIGGLIFAPGLARGVAAPFGRFFYPDIPLDAAPLFSLPRGYRQQGRWDDALDEYRLLTTEFPDALDAYLEMIDMVILEMNDRELGREIMLEAMVAVRGEAAHRNLRDRFTCACTVKEIKDAPPQRLKYDLFEDDDTLMDEHEG